MQKINKLSPTLVKNLSVASESDTIDFLVYGKNLNYIKNSLEQQNCKVTVLNIINAVAGETTKQNFVKLNFCRNITKINASAKVKSLLYKTMSSTNIDALHKAGFSGKGVTVAIIDTGVSPHFDLMFPNNKIKFFKSFVDENQTIHDDNGHGTFVAGTIASSGLLSGGKYKGVAPKCNLVALKALNSDGEASAVKILEAMQWVKFNAKEYNIKVLCLSIGAEPEGKNDPLMIASQSLIADGIAVVAAAGNSGPIKETIKSPGTSRTVITVGAVNDRADDNILKIAEFSSRGPALNLVKPDVVTPGVNIVGLSSFINSPYIVLSGTSMSAPVVAGFCALLLEKNPNLTPLQLKYIVKNCAKKISGNPLNEGSGMLDASKLRFNWV